MPRRVLSADMERACESCAGQDDDLALVRVVAGPSGDDAGGVEQTELWCFGCRAERAHELAED